MKTEFALLLIIPLILQIGCEKQSRHGEPPLNPANMDLTVEPGVDFFRYANGNWMAQNPVPDDFSRYSAFEQLAERNNDDIKALLDEAASKADKRGGNWQKIGLFYTMGMDTVQIEEQGLAPLAAEFSRIDSLKTVIPGSRTNRLDARLRYFVALSLLGRPGRKKQQSSDCPADAGWAGHAGPRLLSRKRRSLARTAAGVSSPSAGNV